MLFAIWLSRRTNWSPALPYPIRQRRDVGEIYRSAFRVYRSRRALFIGIGLMAIPLGALAAIAQSLLFGVTGLTALTDVAVEDPVVGAFAAVLFGVFTTLIAATLVYAACAEALDRIDEGEHPDVLDAYRGIVPALLPLAWATLRMTIVARSCCDHGDRDPVRRRLPDPQGRHAAVDRDRGARGDLRPEAERRPGARQRAAGLGGRRRS